MSYIPSSLESRLPRVVSSCCPFSHGRGSPNCSSDCTRAASGHWWPEVVYRIESECQLTGPTWDAVFHGLSPSTPLRGTTFKQYRVRYSGETQCGSHQCGRDARHRVGATDASSTRGTVGATNANGTHAVSTLSRDAVPLRAVLIGRILKVISCHLARVSAVLFTNCPFEEI